MTTDLTDGRFHLDKRVPIVPIISIWLAIIVQTFGLGLWIGTNQGTTDGRLVSLESSRTERTVLIEAYQNERVQVAQRLTSLETEMKNINGTLLRIEGLIRLPIEERKR